MKMITTSNYTVFTNPPITGVRIHCTACGELHEMSRNTKAIQPDGTFGDFFPPCIPTSNIVALNEHHAIVRLDNWQP